MKTLYTAVGRFKTKGQINNLTCPVICVGGKELTVNLQEMIVWTILNWRIVEFDELSELYTKKCNDTNFNTHISIEDTLKRLEIRGLISKGSGTTSEDALYNLFSSLYIIPITDSKIIKIITFLKLILFRKTPIKVAKRVFLVDSFSEVEKEVLSLLKQASLTSVEAIESIEMSRHDKPKNHNQPVILAIANLYLRQHIIFERGIS